MCQGATVTSCQLAVSREAGIRHNFLDQLDQLDQAPIKLAPMGGAFPLAPPSANWPDGLT